MNNLLILIRYICILEKELNNQSIFLQKGGSDNLSYQVSGLVLKIYRQQ